MKTDKILLNVSSLDNIEEYKELGVSNFLFPLENYSVGYNTFSFEDIKNFKDNAYVLTIEGVKYNATIEKGVMTINLLGTELILEK